jgi:hypothetical protein
MEALTTDESETDLTEHGPCPPEIVIYFCQETATVTGFSEAVNGGFPFTTGLLFSHENKKIAKTTITSRRNNSENLVFIKPPMSVSVKEYWLRRITGGACFFFYSSFSSSMLAMNLQTINLFCTMCNYILKPPAVMHFSGQAEPACPAVFWRGAPG